MSEPPPGTPRIDVLVMGAASRDIAPEDPRGWRLGGPVTFASLTMARLGLRVAAVLGVDAPAAGAHELDLLRAAGVHLHLVPLDRGPVFQNVESPAGRTQRWMEACDPLRPEVLWSVPSGLRAARGWFAAPVADELSDVWADAIPDGVPVALGWQGLLRTFAPGGQVVQRVPWPSRLVARATLVGLSRDDVAPGTSISRITALLAPPALMALTCGRGGGLMVGPIEARGGRRMRRYPAIPSDGPLDATGAGDAFLAALFAAQLEPRLVGGRGGGADLLLAAAVGSCCVERPGLLGVPSWSAVRGRLRDGVRPSRRRL